MHNESNDYSLGMVAFLAGAFIGAGIALLLAPQSGTETRTLLRDYAGKAKDEMYERGREAKETFDSALERGKQAYETVKERGREAYETGKEAMRGAQETGRNRG
ncbi:MAG: YtxH domain-containing protein [Nitrospirae bacterium]|nr:MAG: YtxH domain-containing protein [Nitrospirota bacterium]